MTEAQRLAEHLEDKPCSLECEALRLELGLCGQLKRGYQEQAALAAEECEALRKDAERFRWMKREVKRIPPGWELIGWDEAIDAAMGKEKA